MVTHTSYKPGKETIVKESHKVGHDWATSLSLSFVKGQYFIYGHLMMIEHICTKKNICVETEI